MRCESYADDHNVDKTDCEAMKSSTCKLYICMTYVPGFVVGHSHTSA